ncbi:MAG: hypothetical protein LBS07_04295 [Prevotellaceae bacterium]|jgi:hypothetical protein|nr:hypothetical protein [Prevotellaceae bacterium]
MNIQGGTLDFEVLFNNGQIDRALEETKRRVQGFSDATAAGGNKMEAAYQSAARYITQGFDTIGNAISINETAIESLKKKYSELGVKANKAGGSYSTSLGSGGHLTQQQAVIQSEINERKKVVAALNEQDAALLKHNHQLEDEKTKVDNATNAQTTFRTQLHKVIEELAMLEKNGRKAGLSLSEIRGSEKFMELQKEAGQLTDALTDARTQARILAHDNAGLQGVISAVSGVTGGFTAAQGAIGLFGEENEDLQKIMLRVQSLMAITMGMQQVANTLNKDSALMIKLNAWWLGVKAKAQVTDTAAAAAGTAANIGLAGAFRLVGAAIKSIPVFGWIAAGIGALISVISLFSSKAREAKKATEEFYKAVAEKSAEPIATVKKLSQEWSALGDNLEAKRKYFQENKKDFDALGGSIDSVYKAEKLLSDPAHVQSFINAQIAKAQASIVLEKNIELVKKLTVAEEKLNAEYEKLAKKGTLNKIDETTGKPMLAYTNQDYFESKAEFEKINKEITDNITKSTNYSVKAIEEMKKTEVETVNKYAAGTVGGNDNKGKDPVIERMEQAKKAYAEYFSWLNAGLAKEAQQEFATLLESGKTYKEYLENRLKEHSLTKDEIHKLNTALAAETTKTVMQEFEKSLQTELNNARSISEMLSIIEKKREMLKTDNSGLKEQKTEVLNKQKEDVVKKVEGDYNEAKKEYSDYLDSKISADVKYFNEKQRLEKAIAVETNEDIKKILQSQLDTLTIRYDLDYEKILNDHRSFEQKKNDITNEYNGKSNVLNDKIKNGNLTDGQIEEAKKALAELEKNYKKSLSDLSVEILQQSETWEKLFTDLDTLTVSEMLKMKHRIEAEFNNLNLSPEALNALRGQLDKVTDTIQKKNPFAALLDAIKKYKAEQSKTNLKDMFKSIAGSIELVKGAFDSVVGGLKELGIAGDEQTQELLNDISEMAGAAGNLAMDIASKNPLQIIQGSISLITSALKVFNTQDRNANRSIAAHAKQVEKLEKSYTQLERAISKALGNDYYKLQQQSIENLKQQQAEIEAMKAAEQSKKKADEGKIAEYDAQILASAQKIEDTLDGIVNNIISTDAKSIAEQLGDAFIEAFSAGENAAESWGKTVDDIVKKIVRNMLIQEVLQKPIGAILEKYSSKWVDKFGGFKGMDVVVASLGGLSSELNAVTGSISKAFENLPEDVKSMFLGDSENSSLSGAIKGASQESIDLLAGQTNAVRVNQVESIEILRNSLIQLTLINANTNKSSKHLESLDSKIGNNQIDPLRAQGING